MSPFGDVSWSGSSFTEALASTSEPDWWTVNVPDGFGLSVALLSLAEDYDLHVQSPSKRLLNSEREDTSSERVVTPSEGGQWDIFVSANASRVSTGAAEGGHEYTLTLLLIGRVADMTISTRMADVKTPFRLLYENPSPGTVGVYLGDQSIDLNVGIASVVSEGAARPVPSGFENLCGIGTPDCLNLGFIASSLESDRQIIQSYMPDSRAIEMDRGMYLIIVRAADVGESGSLLESFTLTLTNYPRVCALTPPNVLHPVYPGMTLKPENPDLYQLGLWILPSANVPVRDALMTFGVMVSPPFTDLFDFTWELDGNVAPNQAGSTLQKPYADLPRTSAGMHTVKLTAKGARENIDPRSGLRHTPFGGESRTVTCRFRGPA